jgi:Acyl-CoA carboxylase epsilon subunit
MTESSSAEPALEVVKGNPSEDELAALLMVLKARAGASTTAPKPADNGWSAYWRAMRAPLHPGPGGWRASGREA